jgi:hypothetical protein
MLVPVENMKRSFGGVFPFQSGMDTLEEG